jgi:hypothetical protein
MCSAAASTKNTRSSAWRSSVSRKRSTARSLSDEFIALGLRVANGRAKLESLDGDPAELPRDRCATDNAKKP